MILLTFISYICYHASRKPISIVKNSKEFLDCDSDQNYCHSWIAEIDGKSQEEAKTLLGLLDTSYLVSYALFMFVSGIIAERVDLRIFLSVGMMTSGLLTILFGAAYFAGIHTVWYLLFIQIIRSVLQIFRHLISSGKYFSGIFQTTGWPGVVTVMANWFGKGIWNSHISIGNILGALIAGAFVNDNWGLSFVMPGMMMCGVSLLIFFCLVPEPSVIGIHPPKQRSSVSSLQTESSEEKSSQNFSPNVKRTTSSSRLIDSAYESDTEPGGQQSPTCEGKAISFTGALHIPGVMEFSLCLFFAKLVSYTFLFWLPNYISSTSGLDARSSATLSTFFDVGGIIGGIVAGLISDKSGMSGTTCGTMLVVAIPCMFLYQVVEGSWCPLTQLNGLPLVDSCYYNNALLLVVTGLLVNGPYALITTAVSAELGTHKSLRNSSKALATVTAIIDGTGSIGAAGETQWIDVTVNNYTTSGTFLGRLASRGQQLGQGLQHAHVGRRVRLPALVEVSLPERLSYKPIKYTLSFRIVKQEVRRCWRIKI